MSERIVLVGEDVSQQLAPFVRMPGYQRFWRPAACAVAAVGGVAGLMFGTGQRTIEPTLSRATPALADSWGHSVPVAHEGVAAHNSDRSAGLVPVRQSSLPPKSLPVAGDEGFWLSRHDLAGTASGAVALGDRITISASGGHSKAGGNARPERVYEVVELRPVAEAGLPTAPAAHATGDPSPKTAGLLTMVICQEVLSPAASNATRQPRIIRFLIDRDPAAAHIEPAAMPAQRVPHAL